MQPPSSTRCHCANAIGTINLEDSFFDEAFKCPILLFLQIFKIPRNCLHLSFQRGLFTGLVLFLRWCHSLSLSLTLSTMFAFTFHFGKVTGDLSLEHSLTLPIIADHWSLNTLSGVLSFYLSSLAVIFSPLCKT